MKKIAKNLFFILLFSLISCLTLYEITEAAPLKDYTQKVTTLEKRGAVKLPKEFGFTPKYYRTKTTSQVDMNQSDVTPSRVIDPPNKMIGEYYLFNFGRIGTKDKKNKGAVYFKNTGYFGKKEVNIKLSFESLSPRVGIGINEESFLHFVAYQERSKNSEVTDVTIEFLDSENRPINLSGYWTFNRINPYKALLLEDNDFERYYVLKASKTEYQIKDTILELTGPKSTVQDDDTFVTTTFRNKNKIRYSARAIKTDAYAVQFTSNSLPAVDMFDITGEGETIKGQNRDKIMKLFELEQRVPFTNKENYQTKYEVSTLLNKNIVVKTEDVKITNDLGQDCNNKFDITLSNSKLTMKAKASFLKESAFYDRIYYFSISGKAKEEFLNDEVIVEHIGTLTTTQDNKDVENKTDKIITTFEPTTIGFLKYVVARTKDNLKLKDISVKKLYNNNEYQMLEFEVPKFLKTDFPKIGKEATDKEYEGWYYLANESQADKQLISISLEGKNDSETIKKFLSALSFTINQGSQTAKGQIKVTLRSDAYTSRIGEDGKKHYYKFIKGRKTWLEAYNDAKKQNFKGLTGYLATLTSEKEHNFVYDNIGKESGWLGGTRLWKNSKRQLIDDDSFISERIEDYVIDNKESQWYWSSGPEGEITHKDKIFFNRPKRDPKNHSAGKILNVYEAFGLKNPAAPEPNNDLGFSNGKNEYVMEFARGSISKYWNDLTYNESTSGYILGYYVEFSEYGSQKEHSNDNNLIVVEHEEKIPQLIEMHYLRDGSDKILQSMKIYDKEVKIGDRIDLSKGAIIAHYTQNKVTTSNLIISDIHQKVTYRYEPTTYTIKYDANGGTGTVPSQTFTIETESLILANGGGFTRNGYLPKRWKTTKTNGETYSFAQKLTGDALFKGNTTLYVDWEIQEVSVTVTYLLENSNQELVDLSQYLRHIFVETIKPF